MTVYNWSALTNNQQIQFNPSTDKLNFDSPSISAASLMVTSATAATTLTAATKSITIQSDATTLTTTNFSFTDGSRLVFANNGASASGGSGNDQLIGFGYFDNYFQASAGNNIYNGGPNGQFGDGIDYSTSPSGVTVNLSSGVAQNGYGGVDQLTNIEHITGSAFADSLTGNASTNWFNPGSGNDTIDGGTGQDVVMYEDASAGVSVNLLTGIATGSTIGTDTLISIEAVHGSRNFNDIIQLSNTSGYVFGRGGNDQITGGSGNDDLIGGSGNDTLNGGDYFDTADYQTDLSDPAGVPIQGVVVNLLTGFATDNWGGTDRLISIEAIRGSSMDDVIIGDSSNNQLLGGDGNDQFTGSGGVDNIDGGNGIDTSIYSGKKSDYNLFSLGPDAYIVTDLRTGSPDGIDTLLGIESLRFSDLSTDMQWAQPIVTSGVRLAIDTSINGVSAFGASDIGEFTGNGYTNYFKFTSYDSLTGSYNLEIVNQFMRNPNYLTGSSGLFGEMYLAVHDYISGIITAGSLSPPSINQVLTPNQFNTFFNSAFGHVFISVLTEKVDASNDGVNSNAKSYGFLTLTAANLDARVMTLGSAGARAIFSNNDVIIGNNGNDLLNGFGGNDTIDGSGGIDTAIYTAAFASSTITKSSNGIYTISSSADGTDTLTNVEYAQFSDQTISLTLNSAPTITSAATGSTPENVLSTTAVYTATATDPDAGTTLAYSISGGVDAALFNINASTGAVTFKTSPNFEAPTDAGANNIYDITIRASDGTLYVDKVVAFTVTNVNEAPAITSAASTSTGENVSTSTAVYTVAASDPDANTTLTYSISGGTDAALFNINASTGAVTFKASPNFEAPSDAGANNVYDITIRASDGMINADKAAAITVTNVNPEPLGPSLWTSSTFTTSHPPRWIFIADVNNDGNEDLVARNTDSSISVLLGNGDGTFQTDATYAAGAGAGYVYVADLNSDGKQDIIVSNEISSDVSILLGNGNGTFQPQKAYVAGSGPISISVADFNGDGKQDLVVENNGDNSVSILLGNRDGTFKAQNKYQTGYSPWFVSVADFNGDGKADLVVANKDSSSVSVLLGNGDGTFQAQKTFAAGTGAIVVSVADLNSDGKTDIVVANFDGGSISVLLGNGDGTFQQQTKYLTNGIPTSPNVGDVNGDGSVDIICAVGNNSNILMLIGNGDGTFQTQADTISLGYPLCSSAIGDLNGDGKIDLVAWSPEDSRISVCLNTANFPPAITSSATATSPENAPIYSLVYKVTATDPDAGTTLAYSISGGADAGLFNINTSTGAVTFKASPNFEAPSDAGANNVYDIIVRASDGPLYTEKAVAITVTDVNEVASNASIHGKDFFWKANASGQHALLSGVTDSVTGGTQPPEGVNAPIQFKNITWDATGHATVDVYAHVTTAVDSIQINLGLGSATNTAFTSTLSADWTLLGNTAGNEYIIGGYSMTSLASGDLKLGTLTFDTGSASQMRLAVDTGSALSSTTQGVINATPYGYTLAHVTTGADGAYSMSPLDAGTYALTATRSTSDIGTAITSADALAALKIAVAMNPNPGTGSAQLSVSPFQIMAADANQDGKVTSADALAILKMAVHMTNAVTPEWMFVEETRDLSGITRTSAAWDHTITVNVQGDTTDNLVGFIKGDVNGSWLPPTGTQYVETTDPNHFTALNNTLHIPMSEWGVL